MTMIDGYDITNTGLMFVADGRPFSVDSTHPNYSGHSSRAPHGR